MFTYPRDVVRALERLRDTYDPRSTSLMVMGRASDPHADPFRAGFLNDFEERHEVLRRLGDLDVRAQRLLVLWHVDGRPVTEIARALGISRVHCYRVRARALASMIDGPARRAVVAV